MPIGRTVVCPADVGVWGVGSIGQGLIVPAGIESGKDCPVHTVSGGPLHHPGHNSTGINPVLLGALTAAAQEERLSLLVRYIGQTVWPTR